MKLVSVIFFGLVLLVSCKKETTTTSVPDNDVIDTVAQSIRYTGNFVNGTYGNVSGQARILMSSGGAYSLALQNMSISGGPDLHVYLSSEIQPVNFIDLGKLSSLGGNQVYFISGSPDFTKYKYALIHCQKYNHLFGSAELK